MNRRDFLKTAAAAAAGTYVTGAAGGQRDSRTKPNILIIIADDCTYNDLPLHGGVNVKTPNIDKLAGEGMVFNKAFLAMAMCHPFRTELYTGLYPARSGSCWNHARSRTGTRSIVHYLGDLGYRVGLAGKLHVGPRKSFPFEKVPGIEGGCTSPNPKFGTHGIRRFIQGTKDRPFCLVCGLFEPHCPWTLGDPGHFDPKKLKLPPYMADTKATRSDYTKYLAEIEVLDRKVGEILKVLAQSGKSGGTLVLFTSEQGSQFPGCKWTNWNTGIHTALVARWPGRIRPGTRTDALVQMADVTPTLVDAAGGNSESLGLDGSSFLQVLLGKADKHREYVYAMHNNIPEGPPYPIRAVADGTYHYIRNLRPEALYIEKHLMGDAGRRWHNYWPSWVAETTFNKHTEKCVRRYMRRPPEQLYRVDNDPCEMTNLADDPKHAGAKARLSAELDRWMKQQGDPGAAIDSEKEWKAAKAGRHFGR